MWPLVLGLTLEFQSLLGFAKGKFRLKALSPRSLVRCDNKLFASSSLSFSIFWFSNSILVDLKNFLLILAQSFWFEACSTLVLDLLRHLIVAIGFIALWFALLVWSLFTQELFVFLDQIVKTLFHIYVHLANSRLFY